VKSGSRSRKKEGEPESLIKEKGKEKSTSNTIVKGEREGSFHVDGELRGS